MSPQYGELRPTSDWDRFTSLGHRSVLAALLHGSQVVALNRGRHLCSAARPSRWALAHILVIPVFLPYADSVCLYHAFTACFAAGKLFAVECPEHSESDQQG